MVAGLAPSKSRVEDTCLLLIVKIKGNPFFDAQNTTNILMLIKSLFDSNGKVIMGGLFILHSLIFTLEAPIE